MTTAILDQRGDRASRLRDLLVPVAFFGVLMASGLAAAQPALPNPAAPTASDPASAAVVRGDQLLDEDRGMDALTVLVDGINSAAEGTPGYAELEFAIGRALMALDLPQSAYTWFERISEQGDTHPRYIETIDWFLKIQRVIPGDTATLERLSEYDPFLYPPKQADLIRFLVGQHFYSIDDLERAIESLESVQKDTEEPYLKAQFLIGVIHTRSLDAPAAGDAFKNILRYQVEKNDNSFVDDMAKRARLALARIFYTGGQFKTAAKYYDQIDETDSAWLDSLFEISWTYFQLESYERALGNLHTLNSPYFFDEYYPESFVLQAVILLTNCDFQGSLRVIEQFTAIYKPLKDELELQLKRTDDPNAFYAYLAQLSGEDEDAELSRSLKKVFNAALRDNKLKRQLNYVLQVDGERNRLDELSRDPALPGSVSSFLGAQLADLTAYRGLIIGVAGQAAKDRLRRVYDELTDLLSQALRVKFETLKSERLAIAKIKRAGGAEAAVFADPAPPSWDEEHMYWPFEGEYWRDELGAYTFLIVDRCIGNAKSAK